MSAEELKAIQDVRDAQVVLLDEGAGGDRAGRKCGSGSWLGVGRLSVMRGVWAGDGGWGEGKGGGGEPCHA